MERPGIHLGVSHGPDGLSVWGATRAIPSLCFVVEVAAPGLIVIKHHSSETAGKFVNVAVLEGDQVKIVDERAAAIPDCPALLTALLGSESPAAWVPSVNQSTTYWCSSRSRCARTAAADCCWWFPPSAMPGANPSSRPSPTQCRPRSRPWRNWRAHRTKTAAELNRTVDAVAGLTAVDGAVVLTDQYEVLGFGAKIMRRKGHAQVEQVIVTEPIEGGAGHSGSSRQTGRHPASFRRAICPRSARYAESCAALVASQDGQFTVFEWSPCENMVHAHRIEALLL